MWYLSPTNVMMSLFDDNTDVKVKKLIVSKLKLQEDIGVERKLMRFKISKSISRYIGN